jgi:2-methylcitrate dehydratase PrpD
MANALGLAWSFAAGSMSFQTEGSWAKRLQVAGSVRSGIQAARLAALGATGPKHVFEREGFFHSYSGEFAPERLMSDLGKNLKITEVGIKPFACCRYIRRRSMRCSS